ncbi:MAG: transposase [Opitutaceae bacterium]|jgi:hypothetical protein|nr:transposase [Opitutaceae bacterium]
MENHLKEHQLDLFGEKLSCGGFAANPLRPWLCALAYTLMERLRAIALKGGELARATLRIIRLKILKLAARAETTVRRIRVRLAGASAAFAVFAHAHGRLRRPGG